MLTIPDLVAQYGITKTTLYKWINKGLFKATARRKGRTQVEHLIDPDSWRSFWEAYQAMPKHGNGRRLPSVEGAPPISLAPPPPGPKFYGERPKCAIDYEALQAQALHGQRHARVALQASGLQRWYRQGHGWVIGGEA